MSIASSVQTPLTVDDVKALRSATHISFFQTADGQGHITAVREVKDNGYDQELRREILCASYVTDFGLEHTSMGTHTAWENMRMYDEVLSTVVGLLKAGDELSLLWYASNNNQNLDEVSFVHDELRLIVRRERKKMTFYMDDRICTLHSTARMVKRA